MAEKKGEEKQAVEAAKQQQPAEQAVEGDVGFEDDDAFEEFAGEGEHLFGGVSVCSLSQHCKHVPEGSKQPKRAHASTPPPAAVVVASGAHSADRPQLFLLLLRSFAPPSL